VAREICCTALSHRYLGVSDELFAAGTACGDAFLLIQGDLLYIQDPESSPVVCVQEEMVVRGACISEAAVWMEWIHVGTAVASTPCQLVVVSSAACLSICMKHRVIWDVTAQYAVRFQNCITSAVPPRPFPTDLAVPNAGFAEIVCSMPENMRKLIGREAASGLWPPRLASRLRTEVLNNSCALVVNSSGKVERLEKSVAVQISADDGSILVQLGESEGTRIKGRCKLPGKTFDLTLTAAEVVKDVLDDFVSIGDCLEVLSQEVEVADEDFSWNQVKARNIRTIFHAKLNATAVNIGRPVFENMSVFSRMGSLRSSSPLPRALSPHDIFAVVSDANVKYFAWLTKWEFGVLREAQHSHYVQRLVSSLSIYRGSTISTSSSQLFSLGVGREASALSKMSESEKDDELCA